MYLKFSLHSISKLFKMEAVVISLSFVSKWLELSFGSAGHFIWRAYSIRLQILAVIFVVSLDA